MQRIYRVCKLPNILVNNNIATRHQVKRSFPRLNYSTLAPTSASTADHPTTSSIQDKRLEWKKYENFTPEQLKKLSRDDFLQIRADLWGRTNNWAIEDRILQVLDDMKSIGMQWTIHEYNEYFTAKLFKTQYDDVLNMYLGEFRESHLKLSIGSFNVILATYISLSQIPEAIQLIQEANSKHDIVPDIRDFERTMSRCMPREIKLRRTAKELISKYGFQSTSTLNTNLIHLFGKQRIEDVRWICEQQKGKKLDITTYNILIKGYTDARLMREATHMYKEMQSHGVKPNAYICSSMLSIYAHTRDVVAAEQVVRDTILGGHRPDEILYNNLIKVYFKCRLSHKAFLAYQEIEKDPRLKVNDVILNTMINGLVINREFNIAKILYNQMIQSSLKPDMITFNTMLKGYTRTGDMASAAGIITDMFKLGMEPDTVTFTTLIDTIFKTKTPKSVEEILDTIKQMGMTPNVYTFNAIINGWVESDNLNQAEKALDLMRESQLKPTIHTYTNLIQGYIKHMQLGKAMETFQTMLRHGIQPDRATFNFMIVGFLSHDRLEDAFTCLNYMLNMRLSPTKDTWSLMLNECCHKKNWAIGKRVVDRLDSSGFTIRNESLKRSYTMVKNHCK
ncbi:hypothetical protein [Parasitella parasitica]|uniref:Pentacotripeptide-repeat region of PRORP domain-containing protein n=1 Tax=Parasitella parasitica TaxID=35722 RepID=A0A0B7NF97_9FUNG|nr:hypothetical protein [Parasitella parasitica]